MNKPSLEDPSSSVGSSVKGLAAEQPRKKSGWLSLVALAATATVTISVAIAYFKTKPFDSRMSEALLIYTFFGSLTASVGSSLVLAAWRNNLWWLPTIPWAAALATVWWAVAYAISLASMH